MAEYIEREAALSGYQTVCDGVECSRCPIRGNGHCKFEEYLRAIPAADVRPVVKAKWELDSDKLPICSNCGEIALQRIFVKVPHLIQDVRMVRSNFCPNCGADMREKS